MSEFFDALETRSPEAREAALLAALPRQIAHAQKASPAFAELLAGVDVEGHGHGGHALAAREAKHRGEEPGVAAMNAVEVAERDHGPGAAPAQRREIPDDDQRVTSHRLPGSWLTRTWVSPRSSGMQV